MHPGRLQIVLSEVFTEPRAMTCLCREHPARLLILTPELEPNSNGTNFPYQLSTTPLMTGSI